MISIKTGCCLKASSCQAELPLRHRHHSRGCPSHNSVWLAQGENGSLWRVRRAAGWQVCICEARCSVYLLSFCLLKESAFCVQKATWMKWHREWSPWKGKYMPIHYFSSHTHGHTHIQKVGQVIDTIINLGRLSCKWSLHLRFIKFSYCYLIYGLCIFSILICIKATILWYDLNQLIVRTCRTMSSKMYNNLKMMTKTQHPSTMQIQEHINCRLIYLKTNICCNI